MYDAKNLAHDDQNKFVSTSIQSLHQVTVIFFETVVLGIIYEVGAQLTALNIRSQISLNVYPSREPYLQMLASSFFKSCILKLRALYSALRVYV